MTACTFSSPVGKEHLERRMDVLHDLDAAGDLPTEALGRLTQLAADVTGASMGLTVLVDDRRQIVVSHVGLGEPWASRGETPLSHSLCQYVVGTGEPLIVSDARTDPQLAGNLAVVELGVVAYAGMPLVTDDVCVGSFCLIDVEPRTWSERDLAVLATAAAAAADELSLHLALARQARTVEELRYSNDVLETVIRTMPGGLLVLDDQGCLTFANEQARALLGWGATSIGDHVLGDLNPSGRAGGSQRSAGACAITRARVTGAPERVTGDTFLRSDGTPLPVAYSVAPTTLRDSSTGLIIVFDDNTQGHEEAARLLHESETLHEIARIRDAIAEERLVLYAQPIVDLASGETIQHELLIRMLDRDGSIVPPLQFLPVAEEYGLIKEIDRYVIERGMRLAAMGHPVEMNVSAHSLSDDQLGAFVEDRLRFHGVDPVLIVFEITETALVTNEEVATQFVAQVSALGCTVALDDFGTGYGSFHYLKHLPVQMLKIDREFVRDLQSDEASKHVVQAIIGLAKGLGKITVAEGIEDAETLATLRDLGVDHAQGYHLGRPAPIADVLPTRA